MLLKHLQKKIGDAEYGSGNLRRVPQQTRYNKLLCLSSLHFLIHILAIRSNNLTCLVGLHFIIRVLAKIRIVQLPLFVNS